MTQLNALLTWSFGEARLADAVHPEEHAGFGIGSHGGGNRAESIPRYARDLKKRMYEV